MTGNRSNPRHARWLILSFSLILLVSAAALAGFQESTKPPYEIEMEALHPIPIRWDPLAPGFERTVFTFKGDGKSFKGGVVDRFERLAEFVVYRVDPARYPVRVIDARSLCNSKKTSLKNAHDRTGALLTVNGGYFSSEGDPMGMVVCDGKKYKDYHEEGGSGALAIYGRIARIMWATRVIETEPMPDYALQNGPLLVDPGGKFGVNVVSDYYFYRTVIGIDKQGRFLVGVTRKNHLYDDIEEGLNLYEAAAIFYHSEEAGGLDADVAMNLDGGTSTGLLFSLGHMREKIKMFIDVPNFVCVMPEEL